MCTSFPAPAHLLQFIFLTVILQHMPAVFCFVFGVFLSQMSQIFHWFFFFCFQVRLQWQTYSRQAWLSTRWMRDSNSLTVEESWRKTKTASVWKRSVYVVYFPTTRRCITSSNLAQMIWHLESYHTCLYCLKLWFTVVTSPVCFPPALLYKSILKKTASASYRIFHHVTL